MFQFLGPPCICSYLAP